MPLSAPLSRELLHTRRIECQGFRRADGLWDVEGRITDVKAYDFDNEWRGKVRSGTPVHDMSVRLTLDDALVVRALEVVTDASPYRICPEVAPNFQALRGQQIGRGWNRKVKELVGGDKGCTHIVELLPQMGTVALQTIRSFRWAQKRAQGAARPAMNPQERAPQLDTCYSWSTEREVVQRWLPQFYTGPQSKP